MARAVLLSVPVHDMLCFVLKCVGANLKLVLHNHWCAFITGFLQARTPFYKQLVILFMSFMLQMEGFNNCKLEMDE